MFDEIEYHPAVGDMVHHPEIRVPVQIKAIYKGPVNYATCEVAGVRFSTLASTLSPVYV
ncbi:hypothetical protein QNA24_29725 [Rhodococcus qingshengii]|uniref:hypothetical protein n=1 Tax=Rhodococcus TaxID=1827 RepID=UPI001E60051E|nr:MULTISPECIES: hypothetical protein [Rhodococcus]MCD2099555.1 hypothetical protein [Rhodococcus rhodochrous]MCD2123923.1 hypothetical protein [Rhodococcus rhodochrous]MCQ4136649.1 hypothetical protein [Rhodococcus rhodochrous]MDJ0490564.1 hypothetical protein [Rhodococcus qingshengii]